MQGANPRRQVRPSRPNTDGVCMQTRFRAQLTAPGLALLAALASGASAHQSAPDQPTIIAPGYAALQYAAPTAGSYQLPPLGPAADADVVDSHDATHTLHGLFDSRVTILAFIYTQCDDVNGCPLASYVMGQMARRLASDAVIAPHLRLVSFSFDPEHDTPATLEKYARSFRPPGVDWDFVTTSAPGTLKQTLARYQQAVQRTNGHTFAHILRVFLIDPQHRIRNIYSTAFLHADTLAADVKTLLLEQGLLQTASADAAGDGSVPGPAGAPADDAWLGLPPPAQLNGPGPTAAQVALGERLFFDRRLSLNRTISCAMCHVPAQGYTVNELATAVGIEGRTVKRNAPTLLNVGFLGALFHDAREDRLEQQIWGPLLARNEMANPSVGYVIGNLARWADYRGAFEAAFEAPASMETLGRALAAYQRTLIAGGSPFDRYLYGGQTNALTAPAIRGLALFRGKARCAACHTIGESSALLTDQGLHNTGLGYLASMAPASEIRRAELAPGTTIAYDLRAVADSAERPPNDLGRYEITEQPADRWKYRTPSLRNVARTRPYMHNGSLSTLADVVAFYNDGGVPNEGLDPLIQPLGLSDAERADLVAFLDSLTSPHVAALVERAARVPVGNPDDRTAH